MYFIEKYLQTSLSFFRMEINLISVMQLHQIDIRPSGRTSIQVGNSKCCRAPFPISLPYPLLSIATLFGSKFNLRPQKRARLAFPASSETKLILEILFSLRYVRGISLWYRYVVFLFRKLLRRKTRIFLFLYINILPEEISFSNKNLCSLPSLINANVDSKS